MDVSFRLSLPELAEWLEAAGAANRSAATRPSHDVNLKGLRLWRSVLGRLTPMQRADLAHTPEMWWLALSYPPSDSNNTNNRRDLDWDRMAQAKPGLIEEEQAWVSEGLLPQRTWSSTEWPAVALLHACRETQRPLPQGVRREALTRAVHENCPGMLEHWLPDCTPEDWVAVLGAPSGGVASNPPLFFSLVAQSSTVPPGPLVQVLRAQLPAPLADWRDSQRENGFFQIKMTEAETRAWAAAGMDVNARDQRGRFPEETPLFRDAFAEPEAAPVGPASALSALRIPSVQALVDFRLETLSLLNVPLLNPQAWTQLRPWDDQLGRSASVFDALVAAVKKTSSVPRRCLAQNMALLLGLDGPPNEPLGQAFIQAEGGLVELQQRLFSMLGTDDKVDALVENFARAHPASCAQALLETFEKKRHWETLAVSFSSRPATTRLEWARVGDQPERWAAALAAWAPTLRDGSVPGTQPNNHTAAVLMMGVGWVARVVSQVPAPLALTKPFVAAVLPACLALDRVHLLSERFIGKVDPIAFTALSQVWEQALRAPTPAVRGWYDEHREWLIEHHPAVQARLHEVFLGRTLPPPSPGSKRARM